MYKLRAPYPYTRHNVLVIEENDFGKELNVGILCGENYDIVFYPEGFQGFNETFELHFKLYNTKLYAYSTGNRNTEIEKCGNKKAKPIE